MIVTQLKQSEGSRQVSTDHEQIMNMLKVFLVLYASLMLSDGAFNVDN